MARKTEALKSSVAKPLSEVSSSTECDDQGLARSNKQNAHTASPVTDKGAGIECGSSDDNSMEPCSQSIDFCEI
jgi:hypothetical protein